MSGELKESYTISKMSGELNGPGLIVQISLLVV